VQSPLKVYGKYMNVNKIKVNACQHLESQRKEFLQILFLFVKKPTLAKRREKFEGKFYKGVY